ncbi:eukaryotic translation initiation factor 3 subunit K [Neocloeon triangulifer]|uniref:eukaryotic translation initiation factor 3 subunit K n=1 Tax=Neocloeon triangulifer TaxID=2078957 RepID=UPI00286F915D|nr:eukaryotic translation initiation factor 3 subunit K [Neocloeon triangulifer]
MSQVENMRQMVASKLKGIERYNPENLALLEQYVDMQARENTYDLEANLAILKLYQLDSTKYNLDIVCQIMLKAVTNFPHTDFVLCKCLLTDRNLQDPQISNIVYLADILERCDFQQFWTRVSSMSEVCSRISGFNDSIRKFVCHVVGITFQTIEKPLLARLLGDIDDNTLSAWIKKYGWKEVENNMVFIANQDDNIKTKNITEKINFEDVSAIMASCR